jgi:hypothetical protein
LALPQPSHISSRGSIYPYDLCQKTQRSGIQASTAEGTACISPHGHRVRRVKSSPLSLSTPKSRISLPTKRLPVLRLAEQHAGKPRFLELPDKSSTCSVASLAQMAARSALAHGGQRLMRNAALETADLQHCKRPLPPPGTRDNSKYPPNNRRLRYTGRTVPGLIPPTQAHAYAISNSLAQVNLCSGLGAVSCMLFGGAHREWYLGRYTPSPSRLLPTDYPVQPRHERSALRRAAVSSFLSHPARSRRSRHLHPVTTATGDRRRS